MREIRIADVVNCPGAVSGIVIAIRCCGGRFKSNGGSVLNPDQPYFIPAEEGCFKKFICLKCGQFCDVSFSRSFFTVESNGLQLVYNGEQIAIVGNCYCQNNTLKDTWTGRSEKTHCVDSNRDGEYTFVCPCDRTHLLVVRKDGKHFHICTTGECPILTAKGETPKGG
ncbi:MAG: hypothetical protein PHG23_01230 [Candidatus Pacebacteria bacterium]|nr:hypothetical protein [Candidatus Paceibacterota bacterium]